MNVLVLGATGATGRLVVEFALSAGHAVTAFVRDPERMPLSHARLRIVEGDALNATAVASAVRGSEAVLCTLGTMPETRGDRARRQPEVPVCSVGTKNILAALPSAGGRLIVESSAGVGDSYRRGLLGAGFVVRLVLEKVMADKEEQEAAVQASACEWTILRPVKLTNRPARGHLKAGPDLRWNLMSTATRADVASYMVNIVTDRETYRKAITLRH